MKKILLIIITIMTFQTGFGQTTIWSEDFESYSEYTGVRGDGSNNVENSGDYPSSVTKWTIDYTDEHFYNNYDYFEVFSTDSDKQLTVQDSNGTDNTGGIVYWISEDINISSYYDVSISMDVHEDGSDMGDVDFYRVQYSIDGGAWTTFDTDGYYENDFTPATPSQTGLKGNVLKIRIKTRTTDGGEHIYFDDIVVQGYEASEAFDSGSQPGLANDTTDISSIVNDDNAHPVSVFEMDLYDYSGDSKDTKVTNIRIKPHTSNTADWINNIQGFVINDGTDPITPISTTITNTHIDFAFNVGDLTIPDDNLVSLYFGVYLNTSNIEDGKILSFMVDADDHGFTADSNGTDFAPTFSGDDFHSNDFIIIVDTTELQFIQQPTDVVGNTDMSPAVTVAYTDANGNVDVDASDMGGTTANLTATGATFSTSTTTANEPTDGIMTFSNIKFITAGTGVTLTVTDNNVVLSGDSAVTSTTFDVTGEPEISVEGNSIEIADEDNTPDTEDGTYFGDINYETGETTTHTFTIKNTGNINLDLTPTPIIDISGTNSGDFAVTGTAPSTPVAIDGTTTFTITFTPSAAGERVATISITNNDTDEATYNFDIKGIGHASCAQLFISEYTCKSGANYLEIYNPTDSDVDMADYEVWRGYNGGDWSSAHTISLNGTLAPGNVYVVARYPFQVPFANVYDANFNHNGDDNIGLAYDDGSGTFALIDAIGDDQGDPGTGWTVAGTANATKDHTLIRKPTVDYPNVDWTDAAGTDAVNSEWIVQDYTTTTQLHHVSNCKLIPLMVVVGHLPGAGNDRIVIDEVLAGVQTPNFDNQTLFEDRKINDQTVSHTFRIWNVGNTDLSLTGSPIVDITGDTGDFSVTTQPSSATVDANMHYQDFIVEFHPTTLGMRTAVVSIDNNNPFENPYTFTIKGNGTDYATCNKTPQTLIFEDFEDDTVTYTLSEPEFTDNNYVYFTRSDGANTGSQVQFENIQGSSYFAAQNTDDGGGGNSVLNIEFYDIDISGAQNLEFSMFVAEDEHVGYEDWDANSYVHVEYRIDGGAFQPLIWIEAIDGNDSAPAVDYDFDGVGDLGRVITDSFEKISQKITVSGAKIDIDIEIGYLNNNYEDIAFDNIMLTADMPITTTWDGSNWSNNAPAQDTKAIFDSSMTISSPIHTCACQVNASNTLTVSADNYLLVESDIQNDGTIVVEHEASLVQYNNGAINSGSGDYQVFKKTQPYAEYDYTYWSSPTTGETIGNVFTTNSTLVSGSGSDSSPADRIYKLDTANFNDGADNDGFDDEGDDWVSVNAATVMEQAKGYIAMGAGADFPFDGSNIATGLEQQVIFKGNVNNGTVSINLVEDADSGDTFTNQNLIGNPYPSAIDIVKLRLSNTAVLEGTFYFWTHDTAINSTNAGPDAYNFTNDDYSVVTVDAGGVFSAAASSNNGASDYDGITASQYIASGQSFLANVSSAGAVTFNNTMRITGENNHFLRQVNEDVSIDRLWLNLTKEDQGIFRQVLVGFYDTATDDYQAGQDGQRLENGDNTDFYSVITNEARRFAIQNLASFNEDKTVPLGIEIVEAGTYEINIDHMEGIFTEGQDVYLEDTQLGIIHDFANGPYVFTSDVVDNDVRFTLRFTSSALSLDENVLEGLVVYPNPSNGMFTISFANAADSSIQVYDITGKVIKTAQGAQIDMTGFSKGVYYAKISIDGQQTVKKLVLK